MKDFFDTIAAVATPLSLGGVGVIRVSGEKAFSIVQKFFSRAIKPGVINHGWITSDGARVDEVIVLYFVAPHSFTGEDVVEIQTHGSPVVVKEVLSLVLGAGARLAERGEFTKRAFLNHKMDLTQAEAVLELIHSKTSKSALANANNLSGALRIEIDKIRGDVLALLAKIVASLDFPDDVAEVEYPEIVATVKNAMAKIDAVLKNARGHNILREGARVAVVGQPNVGKSSLFNALLSIDRAIVTDIAGTTRDTIHETLDIKGISVTLIDTAGIREEKDVDVVEKIGILNAKGTLANAQLVLCLFDGSKGLGDKDEAIFNLIPDGVKKVLVSSKADISPCECGLNVSAVTLFGIENLKNVIYEEIIGLNQPELEFSTNQRQQECLKRARLALELALNEAVAGQLQDLISIDIKSALSALGEITGEVLTDEVLGHIFESFCIGK